MLFAPILPDPFPESCFSSFSVAQVLHICVEVQTILLENKQINIEQTYPYYNKESSKSIFIRLMKTAMNLLDWKCLEYLFDSAEFCNLLRNCYSTLVYDKKKGEYIESQTKEYDNHFISLLKNFLTLIQSKRIPQINRTVDILDLERSVGLIQNNIISRKFVMEKPGK